MLQGFWWCRRRSRRSRTQSHGLRGLTLGPVGRPRIREKTAAPPESFTRRRVLPSPSRDHRGAPCPAQPGAGRAVPAVYGRRRRSCRRSCGDSAGSARAACPLKYESQPQLATRIEARQLRPSGRRRRRPATFSVAICTVVLARYPHRVGTDSPRDDSGCGRLRGGDRLLGRFDVHVVEVVGNHPFVEFASNLFAFIGGGGEGGGGE